jgi:hypothetical protein
MDRRTKNLVIASNLYRASAFLSVIAYYLADPRPGIINEFIILVLTILIARLIRKGFNWTKWVLLALWLLFFPLYIYNTITLKRNLTAELPDMVVSLVQIISLIYLFLPYTMTYDEDVDE